MGLNVFPRAPRTVPNTLILKKQKARALRKILIRLRVMLVTCRTDIAAASPSLA